MLPEEMSPVTESEPARHIDNNSNLALPTESDVDNLPPAADGASSPRSTSPSSLRDGNGTPFTEVKSCSVDNRSSRGHGVSGKVKDALIRDINILVTSPSYPGLQSGIKNEEDNSGDIDDDDDDNCSSIVVQDIVLLTLLDEHPVHRLRKEDRLLRQMVWLFHEWRYQLSLLGVTVPYASTASELRDRLMILAEETERIDLMLYNGAECLYPQSATPLQRERALRLAFVAFSAAWDPVRMVDSHRLTSMERRINHQSPMTSHVNNMGGGAEPFFEARENGVNDTVFDSLPYNSPRSHHRRSHRSAWDYRRSFSQRRKSDLTVEERKREFDARELERKRKFELDMRRLNIYEEERKCYMAQLDRFVEMLQDLASTLKHQGQTMQNFWGHLESNPKNAHRES